MLWLKIFLGLFGLLLLYLVVRFVRAALRFKRSFDDFSVEAGERLLRHADEVNSTLERWHEYDEAYQEAVAKIEAEQAGDQSHYEPGRGATLGPTGGSLRKPN